MLNYKLYNNVENIEKLTKHFSMEYPSVKALSMAHNFFTSKEYSDKDRLALISRLGLMPTTGTGIPLKNGTIVITNRKSVKH